MTHIGILGGGQLAKMTLEAAEDFSCETTVLEKDTANLCKNFSTDYINGSLQSSEDIARLVSRVDITTYEIEHIDIQTLLDLEAAGHVFAPSPKVLQIIQDKGVQKDFFTQHNLPTAPYTIVASSKDISPVTDDFSGELLVVKSCTGGYDGKGVVICQKDQVDSCALFAGPCVVEQFVSNATEIAVMVCRDMSGNISTWDPVEMVFNKHNTLAYQICPARISQDIAQQARTLAMKSIESFSGVGVFAVEFFLTSDTKLLINEIAPRPHNSGHHTIEASFTSQFSQLCRILLGKELGSTDRKMPSMMVNLLGPADYEGDYTLVDQSALEMYENVYIHLYGKSPSRPNRKLGHITLLGDSIDELLEQYTNIHHLFRLVPSNEQS